MEAIDRSGLGNKEDNINDIADLKSKKLKIEANRIKIEAKRDTTQRKIDDLTKQIEEQETKIMNLEATGVPEPETPDVVKKGEGPEETVSETKSEEPEAKEGKPAEQ